MRPTPSRCDGSIDATAARAPKFKHVCHGLPRKWSKKRHVGVERTQVWRTCDQTSLAHTRVVNWEEIERRQDLAKY